MRLLSNHNSGGRSNDEDEPDSAEADGAYAVAVERLHAVRRLIACVEATSYSLLRRRILSAIAVCSIVWLASLWLGAALAQAQESPSDESGISVSQPLIAQPSIAATEPRHLVSQHDRS